MSRAMLSSFSLGRSQPPRAAPTGGSGAVARLASARSIAAFVEMQSIEDRQRLEQLAPVRETLDHLPGTVNVVLRLYHEIVTYHAQ
jgi:hypothetical protein